MSKCTESGCRNLQTICADCGRIVCTKKFPEPTGWIYKGNTLDLEPITGRIEFVSDTNEWISVKDRLPDFFESVLAFDGGSIYLGYRLKIGEIEHFWSHNTIDDNKEFTHWMPLPKLPGGK